MDISNPRDFAPLMIFSNVDLFYWFILAPMEHVIAWVSDAAVVTFLTTINWLTPRHTSVAFILGSDPAAPRPNKLPAGFTQNSLSWPA